MAVLERALGTGGRVLDLGSGTGEHSRFLASKGFEVVGIDPSPAMLSKAGDAPLPSNLTFVEGDISDIEHLMSGLFDGAICLGNALPIFAISPRLPGAGGLAGASGRGPDSCSRC